jgi:hypothetical protein
MLEIGFEVLAVVVPLLILLGLGLWFRYGRKRKPKDLSATDLDRQVKRLFETGLHWPQGWIVYKAVMLLPDKHRYDERSMYRQVSMRLGVPVAIAQRDVRRAAGLIQKNLEKPGFTFLLSTPGRKHRKPAFAKKK